MSLPFVVATLQRSSAREVTDWLEWAGFRFDPFGPLDAAADPHLSEYLVGHHIFARVWGDDVSWVFAPAGGGKTALRISVTQACWVGQETNRPFPVPYVLPFLSWGHARPSKEDHLAAVARAGTITLFLAMGHRPHWFFRLDESGRRHVLRTFRWNLPGPLPEYLERCRQAMSIGVLAKTLDSTFILRDAPDPQTLLQWCDALGVISEDSPLSLPAERWADLKELLLNVLSFPTIYILADGFDGAPETITDPVAVVECLRSLLPLAEEWAEEGVFLKAFLPAEAFPLLAERFPKEFTPARTSVICWTPDLLAEVIRRRVYVATEGAFGSLDAVASHALRDIETTLAKAVLSAPREILVLARRVVEEHIRRDGCVGLISEEDLEAALHWYLSINPKGER